MFTLLKELDGMLKVTISLILLRDIFFSFLLFLCFMFIFRMFIHIDNSFSPNKSVLHASSPPFLLAQSLRHSALQTHCL